MADDQAMLQRLTHRTARILDVLHRARISLTEPENILALQAAGIIVAEAMGADTKETLDGVITITRQLNIDLAYIKSMIAE